MAPSGPPPMTEEEYWRDYEIIKNDVHAAMVSCYTHRTINHIAATNMDILEKTNRPPDAKAVRACAGFAARFTFIKGLTSTRWPFAL